MTTESLPPVIPGSRLLHRRPIWADGRHRGATIKWGDSSYPFWVAKSRPLVYRIPRSRTRGDAYYALPWESADAAGVVSVEEVWFPPSACTFPGTMAQDERGNIGILQAPKQDGGRAVPIEWPCKSYADYKERRKGDGTFRPQLLGPLTAIARKAAESAEAG